MPQKPVDDAGYRREQIDRECRPAGAASPGANSERKTATPNASGVAMSERENRGNDRAVNRRRRAEMAGDGIPVARRQEREAERAQRRPRRDADGDEDQQQENRHERREADDRPRVDAIADLRADLRPTARRP